MRRREFLAAIGSATCVRAANTADIALRISPVKLEIAPGKIVKTTGYNGSVPGPVLRLPEGKPVTIAVQNDTSVPELVHWHGLFIPSDVDGSAEEGTPAVPPHGSRRYTFTPRPSGTRWYHTHTFAGRDLKRSTYTGQYGFLYVEPKEDPARFDAEIFLALHGWDPYFSTMANEDAGLEVVYKRFSVNSRALGHGEPIRVKPGQRVMFRVLNANATMMHSLALPGHKFNVVSLDGNRVPTPQEVEVLDLSPAERIDAIVTMDHPGVWILGDPDDRVRNAGLGVIVEYADRQGLPQWALPGPWRWDYTRFGSPAATPLPDAEAVPLLFKQKFAGNRWV